MRKHVLHDYARFSRKSRTGIITLLVCILLLSLIPFLLPLLYPPEPAAVPALAGELSSLPAGNTDTTARHTRIFTGRSEENSAAAFTTPARLFYFDPNSLNDAGWLQLGLREKTVRTIRNYLSKGGRFRKAEDLQNIWGLHPATAEKLIPFVRIETPPSTQALQKNTPYKQTFQPPAILDINQADTSDWIALPGIGNKLAARIVAFREKLGGFHRPEQVGETYGLADSVFNKILPRLSVQTGSIRRININEASLDELKAHPYIRFNLANAVIQYRLQHGPFKSLTDLLNLAVMNEELLQKISPYLRTD